MNSLLRGMSLLPGFFWITDSERVKVLSEKLAKQTTEIENMKNCLWNKNYECDLQASQLAAQKLALGNLRIQLESKADNLRRQVWLVKSERREAQTKIRAQKHHWEIKQLKKKIWEMSETLQLKSSDLSSEKAKVGRLSLELTDLKTAKEISFEKLCDEEANSNDLSVKLDAEISKRGAQAIEIKDCRSEIAARIQELGEKSKVINDLQKDIQENTKLLREHENTIERNALEVQKKSKILWEQERQIAHNAVLIPTITLQQKELQEQYEKVTQKLKDLQEDSQKQTQKMKFLQEYNKLSTKKIYKLERNLYVKTRAINELNSNMKIRNDMIRKLENTIQDHVKDSHKQAEIIATRSKEIEELRIEQEVKSTEIANLSGNLQRIKRGREYQVRTIEKIKKCIKDQRLLILEKDALLDSQDSQLQELKARLKEGATLIASQSGEIEKMRKWMQMKQHELQSQTEVKYLRAHVEEQEEDVCAPAGGLKKAIKRERDNKSRAITRSSKRFRKTEH